MLLREPEEIGGAKLSKTFRVCIFVHLLVAAIQSAIHLHITWQDEGTAVENARNVFRYSRQTNWPSLSVI